MQRLALVAMWLVACGREAEQQPAAVDSAPAVAPPAEFRPQAPRAMCPATGSWSPCAVLERLDRAGLAPRADSMAVTEPPLTRRGILVRIANSELELYLYPDVASRERELRLLDRARYVAFDAPVTMQSQPTLIYSANLIVILHSRNDHQRERVADAITAGPPQPPRP